MVQIILNSKEKQREKKRDLLLAEAVQKGVGGMKPWVKLQEVEWNLSVKY